MKDIQLPKFDFTRIGDDFKNLDPKDVGNWAILPKLAVLLGLLIAAVAAGWWFLWEPLMVELEQKRAEEESLKEQWLQKKGEAVNLEQYQQQLSDIDRSFGALLKQLPNKAEMESLLVDISQAGLSRGLQFEIWRPGSEAVKDFYAELPITLRVTGGYHDLGSFAGDVAKLSRIVTIGSIGIESGKDGLLKMDAVATTYRYLDEEELARVKREKAEREKGNKQ
ncbi:type 4a pilus biogenesis protein PilO [Methyloversatilis sp.]|uniref:type 4a pilus biogenesis protein PilO n=1 Tax=Methyloversatilis sp. TaxID=2569862 RepID=UPI0027363DEF|nr:type 4a pilus biogenesis protein PilO [Methyloversatilis sp.]MDP2870130.1 type 4a pilus biogenesis protein PilO [Methyloversatilis sp.]MDP3288752.1 type 4a pilus biogenesis protein PilO [Methyloversatilis sp.]MDP3457416.1 type 4a pilus biogenesis protein PilO [Methyloversatilis sp.]MDP3578621.1 type 4a pilus biogenesis protein PilO [Methyloversatilis sp.]